MINSPVGTKRLYDGVTKYMDVVRHMYIQQVVRSWLDHSKTLISVLFLDHQWAWQNMKVFLVTYYSEGSTLYCLQQSFEIISVFLKTGDS